MEERTGTGTLRVATLNLWGRRGAWDERRRALAEGFRALAPDLVAFQEAVVGNGYDQVIDVLGQGYHTSPSDHFGFCADLPAQTSTGRPVR